MDETVMRRVKAKLPRISELKRLTLLWAQAQVFPPAPGSEPAAMPISRRCGGFSPDT